VESYTDLAEETAVLAARLIDNHPLPDGDKPSP
jgi:prophage maintenance system killer protein